MASFEQRVEQAIGREQSRRDMGMVVSTEYKTTKSGQRVCFVTSRVVWYASRVYVDDCKQNEILLPYARSEHLLLSGVTNRMMNYLDKL